MKFCYDDSFDILISCSTVLCSGLIFSLLHITFRSSSLALQYKVKENVFICLFYPAHLENIFSTATEHCKCKGGIWLVISPFDEVL